jgi:TPP-dependent 2-oxoacid decarboxylase
MTKPKQAIKLNNDMGELASVHRQQIAIQIAIGKLEKKLEQNEHYIETLMEANQDPNESMVNAYAKINKNEIYANIFHENLKLS